MVCQGQEKTTQRLSMQAHKNTATQVCKKKGNEFQPKGNQPVTDCLSVVVSCLDRVEATNMGGGGKSQEGRGRSHTW